MRQRLDTLDVIRGFALCGIAFVNVPPILDLWDSRGNSVRLFLDLFVQQRFFPIFSFLFGLGASMMYLSAHKRAQTPRRVMLRRFALLALFGGAHQFAQPGEALLPYAIVGLVLLLPLTFIPRDKVVPIVAPLGVVLTAVGVYAGGLALIPGLFALGFAAATAGLPWIIDKAGFWVWPALGVSILLSAGLLVWDYRLPLEDTLGPVPSIAGLSLAITYVLALVAAMSTVARKPLTVFFAPLGRMALTNYLMATAIFHAFKLLPINLPASLHDRVGEDVWLTVMGLTALMLVGQWIFSVLWLRAFKRGPMEALWRLGTWKGEPMRQPQ